MLPPGALPSGALQAADHVSVLALEAVDQIARTARRAGEDVPGVGLDLEVELGESPALGPRERRVEHAVGVVARRREPAVADGTEVDGDVEVAAPLGTSEPR